MKALLSQAAGGPETLVLADRPVPTAGRGELLVKILVCAINYPDVLIIEDKYQFKPERPFAPGSEICAEVAAVGGLLRRQMHAHVDLMRMSVLGAMEADLDDQNGLAILRGDHLTIGEAAPQEMLGHVIVHRLADIARAQEGRMEAMGQPPLPFGLGRGHQRLRDRLPAEDAPGGPIQPFAARGKRRSRHGINQAANVLRPYQGYILSHEDHIVGSG